jgi:hypothetical protein
MLKPFYLNILCLILISTFAIGCVNRGVKPGTSTPFQQVFKDRNPNILWVSREVVFVGPKGFDRTYHVLMACYRSMSPSPPKCYSAEIYADKEHSTWPNVEDDWPVGKKDQNSKFEVPSNFYPPGIIKIETTPKATEEKSKD